MAVHQPAMILVRPQLGENIGKAARAMLNFGLSDMRIVAPRDGWPNPAAVPAASGADVVLDNAQVFDTVEDAIADCTLVFASTVRDRNMPKPVATPKEAAAQMRVKLDAGEKPAILFGPERSGLTSDDVALADTILTVPVNPEFGSLNLAQAVILCAYEFDQTRDETPAYQAAFPEGQASKQEFMGLLEHLESALEAKGFFRSAGRRDSQRRMLHNLMHSAGFSSQEVQTMRGIIKSLARSE
ncbi:RNA methyltransferase [Kordiimonas sp. SCSIO 12610]|uniref:RNA methyltransferase n=1 Tax=Kordiimonas sp. SCSIO 12610 TaxID=2829597 RepID=UPI00210E79A0|nr:RNA methyltransferase [Kordiimonas sp. SCSIO 12610]UTW54134.1 RNA methyltransferase [Kordiimonas sp. SCSIO 12610]